MLEFEKSIIHILDCEHNTMITSNECITEFQPEVEKMLQTKGGKVFSSAAKKSGQFKETSATKLWIEQYKTKGLSFEELSEKMADHIFQLKMKYALYQPSDVLISEVLQDGRRYLLIIDNAYSEGITHHLQQEDETILNTIIPYRTLLSTNLVKADRAFLIELSDMSVHCVEAKVEIEAQHVNFFADVVFQSTTAPSYQEAVKSITKITEEMGEKYDLNEVELLPRMKSIIKDNVDTQTPINIDEVAKVLFADKPLAKGDFKEELRKQGVQEDIGVEYVKSAKSEKVQKIKTDKGIEIIIPVDFMNSKDFVEFQTQPDGTISIQLKNINRLTSK